MMIIDAHAHLWGSGYTPAWWEESVGHGIASFRNISLEQAIAAWEDGLDPYGDKIIAEMDAGGVDIALVVTIDYGLVLPGAENDCRVPIEEQFVRMSEAAGKHPNRLFWGAGIDPRRINSTKLVELAVKDLMAKAIKLYPPNGFYPNDKIVYPIYEKAVEFGVPVQLHVAPAPPGLPYLRSKFCHPIHIDDVAVDFPELKIQAVHSGGPWFNDMMAIAEARPNIYLDVGGWQPVLNRDKLECYRRVRKMFDEIGPERVMWASDWVGPSLLPQTSWLEAFLNIPQAVKEAGIEFTEEEKRFFLGRTASDFLGIYLG
ncbi:amidohydrolase family protein [Chloroflexota bacterium]